MVSEDLFSPGIGLWLDDGIDKCVFLSKSQGTQVCLERSQ